MWHSVTSQAALQHGAARQLSHLLHWVWLNNRCFHNHTVIPVRCRVRNVQPFPSCPASPLCLSSSNQHKPLCQTSNTLGRGGGWCPGLSQLAQSCPCTSELPHHGCTFLHAHHLEPRRQAKIYRKWGISATMLKEHWLLRFSPQQHVFLCCYTVYFPLLYGLCVESSDFLSAPKELASGTTKLDVTFLSVSSLRPLTHHFSPVRQQQTVVIQYEDVCMRVWRSMQSWAQVQSHPVPLFLRSEAHGLETALKQTHLSCVIKGPRRCLLFPITSFYLRIKASDEAPVVCHQPSRGLIPCSQCPEGQVIFSILFKEPEKKETTATNREDESHMQIYRGVTPHWCKATCVTWHSIEPRFYAPCRQAGPWGSPFLWEHHCFSATQGRSRHWPTETGGEETGPGHAAREGSRRDKDEEIYQRVMDWLMQRAFVCVGERETDTFMFMSSGASVKLSRL